MTFPLKRKTGQSTRYHENGQESGISTSDIIIASDTLSRTVHC